MSQGRQGAVNHGDGVVRGRAWGPAIGWRVAAGLVGGFFVGPVLAGLAGIILPALGYLPALGHERIGLAVLGALLDAPGITRSAWLSAWTGLSATVLSLGVTAALLAATFGTRALGVVERLLSPLLAVPHVAAALGFVVLLAPSGLLLRLLSPWATGVVLPPDLALVNDPAGISLMAALVVKEVPFLFLMALAALPQVKADARVAVARALGYGRMTAFLHAVWPLVYRQIRLPVLAVLAFGTSVVDVALILGPTRPPPLSVRVIEWLSAPDLDSWLLGSAAALAMLVLVLGLIALWLAAEKITGLVAARLRVSGWRARTDGPVRAAVVAVAALGALAMAAGLCGLLLRSVAGYWPFPDVVPTTFSLAAWTERLPAAATTLGDTLIVAGGATAIALPLAIVLLEAGRRGVSLSGIIYLPLLVPQVAFLFGLTVLAIAAGLTPGLLSVTLAHALFTLPYALIALSGPWAALDPGYERVAASLGTGPLRRFVRIRLAMATGPLAVAAALSVAVSAGLYLPTQMIGGGRVETVTTEAVAAAAGGDRRLVGMLACLQLALPLAAFAAARAGPAALFRNRRGMRPQRSAP